MSLQLLTQFGISVSQPSFEPSDISGLNIWFDPDDLSTVTESAGKVSQLNDKASGNHLSQGVSANQPTLETGANNYLFFNGNHWLFRTNAEGVNNTVTNDMTAFIVKKDPFSGNQNNSNPHYFNCLDQASPATGYHLYRDSSSYQKYIVKASGSFATDYVILSPLVQNNTPSLGTFIRNGQICTTQINITTTASDTGGSPGPIQYGNPSYGMGAIAMSPAVNHLVGRIGEVLVYNRVLTSQEKIKVETYLQNKWGI